MAASAQRGFTLVEVLIAFSILAIILTGTFRSMALGHRGAHDSAARIEAVRLAESKLETLGISDPIASGQQQGQFSDRYRWEMSVTPYLSQNPGAYETAKRPHWVELTVLWSHRSGTRINSVTLRTIKLAVPL